jgi:transcriptional regulator with XRE-family HTH domain
MYSSEVLLQRLGAELRALRESRGLTQAQIADAAGVPRLKVIQIEKGLATVSAGAYAAVAVHLGVEFATAPARRPTQDEIARIFPLES